MIKKLILFSFLFISNCFANYKYELSVCAIFRDEAPYLKEWIEFHRLVGVEHFYLANHNSSDNYLDVLEPYIREGIVELRHRTDDKSDQSLYFFLNAHQNPYFNEMLKLAKDDSKWIAFLDTDEFLYPVQKDSLVEFLKDYEEFGGVCVNWQMFGTGGIVKFDPKKTMIEQLIRCANSNAPVNMHVKSIVRADRAKGFGCPHFAAYIEPYFQVNTNKEHFGGPWSPYVLVDKLRINHYWTRDEYYLWNVKIPRQRGFGTPDHVVLGQNNEFSAEIDLSIQRFVPALRKRMGLD
jgi:hypothetical protein